jgi:hypothetical protein
LHTPACMHCASPNPVATFNLHACGCPNIPCVRVPMHTTGGSVSPTPRLHGQHTRLPLPAILSPSLLRWPLAAAATAVTATQQLLRSQGVQGPCISTRTRRTMSDLTLFCCSTATVPAATTAPAATAPTAAAAVLRSPGVQGPWTSMRTRKTAPWWQQQQQQQQWARHVSSRCRHPSLLAEQDPT